MNVRLVSRDPGLHRLFAEIQNDVRGCRWCLLDGDAENTPPPDLCIWDFEPDREPSGWVSHKPGRHFFLVNRRDVAKFQASSGLSDSNILLKPVNRVTMTAFLAFAVAAHERDMGAATGVKADRDEMLQCLIQANLKLQEFDEDRTNFLARALHDFRAPLTAISGYCDLLLNEDLGPLGETQKEVLRRMSRSNRRLSRMASAMYQLSIGRQLGIRIDRQEADIQDRIDQALHEIAPNAASKEITISIDLDPETSLFSFDPSLIEEVLVNLLDNACRFTPKQGEIVIRAYPYFWERRFSRCAAAFSMERRLYNSTQSNSYRVDILNTGVAIPGDHLEDIFEEYTSYSGGKDRSGGGLGLAICRMIIARHGGRIWAENRDGGPAFCFVLPLRDTSMSPLINQELELQ